MGTANTGYIYAVVYISLLWGSSRAAAPGSPPAVEGPKQAPADVRCGHGAGSPIVNITTAFGVLYILTWVLQIQGVYVMVYVSHV